MCVYVCAYVWMYMQLLYGAPSPFDVSSYATEGNVYAYHVRISVYHAWHIETLKVESPVASAGLMYKKMYNKSVNSIIF